MVEGNPEGVEMRYLVPLTLVVLLASPVQAKPHHPGPCNKWRYRHIVPSLGLQEVQRRVKVLIRCAARKWPVDLAHTLYIANRESHYWCWAVNPSGSTGVFQVISSTWDSWRASFPWLASVTIDNRLNCRSNVLLSVRVQSAWGYGAWGG